MLSNHTFLIKTKPKRLGKDHQGASERVIHPCRWLGEEERDDTHTPSTLGLVTTACSMYM